MNDLIFRLKERQKMHSFVSSTCKYVCMFVHSLERTDGLRYRRVGVLGPIKGDGSINSGNYLELIQITGDLLFYNDANID